MICAPLLNIFVGIPLLTIIICSYSDPPRLLIYSNFVQTFFLKWEEMGKDFVAVLMKNRKFSFISHQLKR